MNPKEYISSGIVEACVLGLASMEEAAEFEENGMLHPEVRSAREAFELQLEVTAKKLGIPVPPHIKSRIFSEIEISAQKAGSSSTITTASQNNDTMVISFRPSTAWWKYIAIAVLILLAMSVAFNFYLLAGRG